jgi:hypothetical protein
LHPTDSARKRSHLSITIFNLILCCPHPIHDLLDNNSGFTKSFFRWQIRGRARSIPMSHRRRAASTPRILETHLESFEDPSRSPQRAKHPGLVLRVWNTEARTATRAGANEHGVGALGEDTATQAAGTADRQNGFLFWNACVPKSGPGRSCEWGISPGKAM